MKSELQIKQLAFLEETCQHYNNTNRNYSSDLQSCMYAPVSDKSEGCAISRKIADKELCKELDTLGGVSRDCVFELLPSELKDLEQEFLTQIQVLHDGSQFWVKNGLSERGLEKKQEIIDRFDL